MKSYKIEITQTQKYIISAKAENETNAKRQAAKKWQAACDSGTYHMHEFGDAETVISQVFDVTGTDDANF